MPRRCHTNSVEGYFSISSGVCAACISTAKRSICTVIFAEYDFRYNHRVALGFNDGDRAALAVKNAAGKRLTYRGAH